MQKQLIISTLFLLVTFNVVLAQTRFERGYFLSNSGEKIDCLIKNYNWLDSPNNFIYKLSENGEEKTIDASSAKEFGIGDNLVYKAVTADIPQTYINPDLNDNEANPKMAELTIFVKKILDGVASLYQFRGRNQEIFLIQKEEQPLEVLLYKKYVTPIDHKIRENNLFRGQLLKSLNCGTNQNIQKVSYKRKSLLSYIQGYNNCISPGTVNTGSSKILGKRKADTRFLLFAGVANYELETEISGRDATFENKIVPVAGFEVESILPFNNRKWSIFLSAQYASYKATGTTQTDVLEVDIANIELNQITTNIGGRHYLFFNKSVSMFLQAGSTIDFNMNSTLMEEPGFQTVFDEISKLSFGGFGGLGFSVDQKYYLNARYLIGTSIFRNDLDGTNKLKRFVFTIGIKV